MNASHDSLFWRAGGWVVGVGSVGIGISVGVDIGGGGGVTINEALGNSPLLPPLALHMPNVTTGRPSARELAPVVARRRWAATTEPRHRDLPRRLLGGYPLFRLGTRTTIPVTFGPCQRLGPRGNLLLLVPIRRCFW